MNEWVNEWINEWMNECEIYIVAQKPTSVKLNLPHVAGAKFNGND